MTSSVLLTLVLLGCIQAAGAFSASPCATTRRVLPSHPAPVTMLFGKAFENDPNVKKSGGGPAGLNKKPDPVEVSFSNGRTVNAIPGQRLSDIARAAGARIQYDCKNGECGTCTVKLNGRNVRTCVTKLPKGGPFTVQVGDPKGSEAAAKTKSLQDQLKKENQQKKKGWF
eukprot:CAMPEP_0119414626 /NCGR_PEP_ID=MMETSP1335-20130426/7092_1 /TAXON_ID=259385 /ORGANISM="Chrysoculter rhomboideus, Strain RCC1486" /LENGTH=169 /DNA_ID=CAMNT_0007439511 /DNA_START=30 /DNA_END=539 /DNA_ORIENTATION=+